MLGNLLRDEPIVLVDGGHQRRSFTYVDDGIDALMRILENRDGVASARIFNIGNPENDRSIKDLAQTMIQILGEFPDHADRARSSRIVEQSSQTYYGKGYQDIPRRVPSIKRARELLRWEPKHDFATSLRKTIAYYVNTASLPGDGSTSAEIKG
jgi:nucleoside-diphosphate-sugar epimerase